MHSRRSSFMRGGSVVGAVLVVALLSAAAVMIDSSSVTVRQAQLAQTSAATTDSSGSAQVVSPQSSSGEITTKCLKGYDFAVFEKEGKASIACKATTQCSGYTPSSLQPALSTQGSDGKAVAVNCDTNVPQQYAEKLSASLNPHGRQCVIERASWECKFYHCSAAYKEGCRLMGTAKEGEAMGSKKVISEASTKLSAEDFARIASESSSGESFSVATGESQFSQALLANSNNEVTALNKGVVDAQADLDRKMFELQECQGETSFVDPSSCQNHITAITAAQQKLDQQKLQLQKYAQSLQGQESQLRPTSPEDQGNIEKKFGQGYCDAECQKALPRGPTFTDDRQTPPPPACNGLLDCWLKRQAGQPDQKSADTYACQYNNDQAACARIGGVGAYGAYGARPSGGQQGCNSNSGMGGGGIFGTIISLVMRGIGGNNSSGGCNNGNGSDAPTPSCTITATPRTVGKGDAVTLSWQSERGFSATLSSSGSVAPSGSMTVNPQTTTTYTLQVNGYIENRTGQQLRGQCSTQVIVDGEGGGTGAPKAEISCRPEVADVGMQVAVSFACANSVASSGNGFSTNNQMSGSATPTIEVPTIGTTNAIFGVTCSKDGKTDTAQCTIAINKTSMVLIANPKNVESGAQANVGWVTSGMQECTISSPTLASFTTENAGNTATSGVAKTPTLVEDTEFELTCTTKSGDTRSAKTTIVVD
jgi:hypothetical protein